MEELLAMIDGQTAFLGIDFDPKDLETIKAKIEEIKNEIQERNPFKALIQGIKDYSKAADDESKKKALTATFDSAAASIDMVKGAFDSVVGALKDMGLAGDEESQKVMDDISGMLSGASSLAMGIASGNPLQIIQGSIDLISNGIKMITDIHDGKLNRSIKQHAEAVDKLESAYTALSWAIDKALGGTVYKNQQAAIANMEAQREHLQAMWQAEEAKKKTDSDKVSEYKEQYEQLGRDIQDMLDEISNDVLQTDAKTFADELGDALVEAFSKGEDAATAFGDTVDNVIKQAVLNQLKKNFLENQLQGALDDLYQSMGGENNGVFEFDGLTDAEIAAFKAQVANITNGFNQALGEYAKIFEDIETPEADTSLTGAVKGVSEETTSLVAGQMNAMRINQVESTAILRQQLLHLANIENNTGAIDRNTRYIKDIYDKISTGDSLRSRGLS